MKTVIEWIKLIAEILALIAQGMAKFMAIKTVSMTHGVDENELKEKFEAYEKDK